MRKKISVFAMLLTMLGCSGGDDGAGDVGAAQDTAAEMDLTADLGSDLAGDLESRADTREEVCLPPGVLVEGECLTPEALATFDDLGLAAGEFWNGSDGEGGIASGAVWLKNDYNAEWQTWTGWAVSAVQDTETPGQDNQYAAIPGMGAADTLAYAVAYDPTGMGMDPPTLTSADGGLLNVAGMFVTNTTWTWSSMNSGDDYCKVFGGTDGTDPDWFLLTVRGLDQEGEETGSVELYLADFRSDDPAQDHILDAWTWLDLSELGPVASIEFTLSSSDVGEWGMNTPAYFAVDEILINN